MRAALEQDENPDPREGLRECAARRSRLEQDQSALVRRARVEGLSWAEIAFALGISRQAAHRKYGGSRIGRG